MLLQHFRIWSEAPVINIGTITFLVNIFIIYPTKKTHRKTNVTFCFLLHFEK